MCGFAGHISLSGSFNVERLIRATDLIKYRGPDDYSYLVFDNFLNTYTFRDRNELSGKNFDKLSGGLGFRRLSIIDLSEKGRQPMCDSAGKVWIVYNGEIYNYVEIRNLLEERGYVFRSGTDTEVILHSYMEWGEACLSLFNGMWSFAIADLSRKRIFCSTDRFGIKPFYYLIKEGNFIFSSEIKQIFEIDSTEKNINEKVLFDYLAAGAYGNETEETFVKNIFRLPGGFSMTVDISDKGLVPRVNRWWKLEVKDEYYCESDLTRISGRIYELFHDSLKIRLRSDVEVGACLSGGLDSSGIVCMLDRILKENGSAKQQKLFTIVSGRDGENEFGYAKEVADVVNGSHICNKIDGTADFGEIEKFIWHNDEPLIKASMFGGYNVYKLVSESGLKVVMDGQGIDEYAGGYFAPPFVELLNYLKTNKRTELYVRHINYYSSLPGYSRNSILESVLRYRLKQFVHQYSSRRMRFKLYSSVRKYLKDDFLSDNMQSSQLYQRYGIDDKRIYLDDIKLKNYNLFTRINLPGILRQVDRNSMASSVEARVPFLDHRLVEYIFSIPSEFIIDKSVTKYAYRVAMQSVIPDNILKREDKIGFHTDEFSIMNSVKKEFFEIVENLRPNNRFFYRKFLLKNSLEMLNDRAIYDNILWRIMNAAVWINKFGLKS